MPIGWSGREALIATNDQWGNKQDLTPRDAFPISLLALKHSARDTFSWDKVSQVVDANCFRSLSAWERSKSI